MTLISSPGWSGAGTMAKFLVSYARGPDHPMKLRILFWLARVLCPSGIPMRHPSGAEIATRSGDFIGWSIIRDGSYEPATIGAMTRLLQEGGTFVDVGANVGLHSAVASQNSSVATISIEAHPENFAALTVTRRRNRRARWTLINCAAAAERCFVEMGNEASRNSGRRSVAPLSEEANAEAFVVAAYPLQEILDAVHVDSVTLMKVDVEGFELQVLKGLDMNGRFRPQYVIAELNELSGRFGSSDDELCEYMLQLGYSIFDVFGSPKTSGDSFIEDNAVFVDARRMGTPTPWNR